MIEPSFIDLGLGIGIVALVAMCYKFQAERQKARDFYLDRLTALKVGLIQDYADKNNITLIFPPASNSMMDKIVKDVEKDISRD